MSSVMICNLWIDMETVFVVRSRSVICLAEACDTVAMAFDVTSFVKFIILASEMYNAKKQKKNDKHFYPYNHFHPFTM
jgi:hypothetical protein